VIVELDLPEDGTRIDLEFEVVATYLLFESLDGTIRIRMEHGHMQRLGGLLQEYGYPMDELAANNAPPNIN
jgi:hypothetical protein